MASASRAVELGFPQPSARNNQCSHYDITNALIMTYMQAHMQLSEFDQSRHYLMKAGKQSPGNAEIRQELEKLNRYVQSCVITMFCSEINVCWL